MYNIRINDIEFIYYTTQCCKKKKIIPIEILRKPSGWIFV